VSDVTEKSTLLRKTLFSVKNVFRQLSGKRVSPDGVSYRVLLLETSLLSYALFVFVDLYNRDPHGKRQKERFLSVL